MTDEELDALTAGKCDPTSDVARLVAEIRRLRALLAASDITEEPQQ